MKRKLGLLALALTLAAPLTACDGNAPTVAPTTTPDTSPNVVTRGMDDMARGMERAARDVGDAARDVTDGVGDMWTEGFLDAEDFDECTTGTGKYAYAPPGEVW